MTEEVSQMRQEFHLWDSPTVQWECVARQRAEQREARRLRFRRWFRKEK